MKPTVTLREALADPALLGSAIPGPSWEAWRVFLIAAVGEPLEPAERLLYASYTGREFEPGEPVEELWAAIGRRAGKTRAAATFAAYIACLCDHSGVLAPGERGVLPILAASTVQATRAFMHVAGIIQNSPVLSAEIQGEPTADTIRLEQVDIEIRPASFKTIRGITAVAAIADEIAFWMVENTVNPDASILAALRPSLATTGGPLIVISSPYARRGELYKTCRRHYGPAGDRLILVANAPSRVFNPTLKQSVIDRAYEQDPATAASEYGGQFRTDIETFIARETVDDAIEEGVREIAPRTGISYVGFVDPSGGASDAMTLAIAHREDDKPILDAVRDVTPPFSPDAVTEEFAALLKSYGLSTVTGDRYGGEWSRERFSIHGITYELSERTKSQIYGALLPILNSSRGRLLDNPKLVAQLCALERRTARGGHDSIDHPPGGHDDLANAAAGALVLAGAGGDVVEEWNKAFGDPPARQSTAAWQPPDRIQVRLDMGMERRWNVTQHCWQDELIEKEQTT
jgi:hypothetical protein